MDTDKHHSFDWLRRELDLIKSERFHIFRPASEYGLFYCLSEKKIALSGDYADFISEFGWANLFCDYNDSPEVTVYPLKSYRRHICKNGKVYIGFGDRGYQHVCFDEDTIINGRPSKVYFVSKNKSVELYSNFSEWLIAAYKWAKTKYSKKQWDRITKGPPSFSAEEIKIVEARRLFNWRLIGFTEGNDALFEVRNSSTIKLPYLKIGIRDVDGEILTGGVWLKVDQIAPGETAIVAADCYKDRIPPDKLEAFDFPDPIPEKKEAYWEFGRPA